MIKAAEKASKILIRDFGVLEKLQVSSKGPGDFVTSADKRTENIIIEELLKAHPNYGVLTEETGVINKENINRLNCVILPMEAFLKAIKVKKL